IWFDYRHDLIRWSARETGLMRFIHRVMTLGATDVSQRALMFDNAAGRIVTIVGIPSAFLLHGYVGFIFGSVKANPWWSSVLMPVVFLFSAIVSGIALVLILYLVTTLFRSRPVDMPCVDKLATFLFYAMIIDVSLEMLDFLHRLYESEESIGILSQMISSRLFLSLIVLQIVIGTLVPLVLLGATSPALRRGGSARGTPELRRLIYLVTAVLVEIGIFSIRWNVVVGGQLFSKSLRGLTVYKVEVLGAEGIAITFALLALPLVILWVLVKVLPPWPDVEPRSAEAAVH
ncbi:MAG: NrfD/PsrC family molybdoenzyme membrane anchor subunit, partial [Micromonosporaceae bacterium]